MAKVIASSLRTGNVVEVEGKLYAIAKAENIHPGKGTPVTHLEMRRVSDGVKVTERYRTTESVEKVYIDEQDYSYLYDDGTSFVFMNGDSFDQIELGKDLLGDQAPYLQESMRVKIKTFEGRPIAVEIPARAILEVVDTEPAMKGQTASSSYKPAILSNGVRSNVPSYITNGTRIVVDTATGEFVERAKE